jgi:hypothetical protein
VKKLAECGLVRQQSNPGNGIVQIVEPVAHKLVMRAELRRRNILSAMTDAGEIIKSGAADKLADIIHKLAGPMAKEFGAMLARGQSLPGEEFDQDHSEDGALTARGRTVCERCSA